MCSPKTPGNRNKVWPFIFFNQKVAAVEKFSPTFPLSPLSFSSLSASSTPALPLPPTPLPPTPTPLPNYHPQPHPDAPLPRTRLHFLLSPCGAAVVMYQLQLTASQVGPRDVSDHRGAARLAQRPDFRPRPQLRPCPRQGRETPGQTTETLPAADCLMLAADRIQAKGGERAAAIPRTFLWIPSLFWSQAPRVLFLPGAAVLRCAGKSFPSVTIKATLSSSSSAWWEQIGE